jgi:uncharacterized membrane protein
VSRIAAQLRARPRLAVSMLVGLAVAVLLPLPSSLVTRALLGWNVATWLYLALVGWMMLQADHHRLRRTAAAEAEGAATVLAIVSAACIASLVGIVAELSAAKQIGAPHALTHVMFALATVAGSWLLLPTIFALTYASAYYHAAPGGGLQFPGAGEDFKPRYGDFLYVSFTIAVAAQTADVCISTSAMRRLVTLQSLLSFAFNTAILAFTINIAASLF